MVVFETIELGLGETAGVETVREGVIVTGLTPRFPLRLFFFDFSNLRV